MNLQNFLEKKPLYYAKIDYARMPRVFNKIKSHFVIPKIVHLVGTNGKGTTGRFLANALYSLGYNTGHYTSPHILEFNERIWINGKHVSNADLESVHIKLQTILSQEDSDSLSYFEYTTFLAMLLFSKCEYIILEAGLGGEYDATAVFPKSLTLVTPIGFDHEGFLGSSIEEIAQTKLRAIQNNAILAKQKYKEVYEKAKEIEIQKSVQINSFTKYLTQEDEEKIDAISKELSLAPYLKENLSLSVSALKFFALKYSEKNFKDSPLFGRLTYLTDQIILDVGHNPLAAETIYKSLYPKKYILVYNTYQDKEYQKVLELLKPIVIKVEILDIDNTRVEQKDKLQRTLTQLKIKYNNFEEIDESQNYLVFGSFSVVENFLKVYSE